MYTTFSVSIFVAIIRLIFCEDKCSPPPEIDRATVSNPSDEDYVLESTVTYRCDHGFIVVGAAKTLRCVRDPTTDRPVWTDPEFTCNPRSCGDPGSVENARRVGSRFTFPNNVEYVCNEGYRRSGPSRRYCQASGDWSGRLPSCNAITCQRPEDPENGRAVYTSLVYDSELRYECNRDLQVSPKDPRYCGADGQWTGTKPVCREIECEMPETPEFGSAELTGKPKVGSIVVYKCNPGRRLVGSGSSKCLKNGEWTFPTPSCVEPCVVPDVDNGELGQYEEEYKRYRWRTVFKKLSVGTILDENEKMILKCNDNYVPKSQPLREISITCSGGQLSPEPECIPTSCLGHPPPIDNGEPVVASRNHGHTIWYRCAKGFEKGKTTGNVECVYGKWVGRTPTCVDTRCDKSSLNYPGLIRSEGFFLDGQSFVPTCRSGYDVTENSDNKIYCRKGSWSGNLPPCTTAQCKTEELLGFSGFVLEGNHRTLDNGDSLLPKCAEGFEFFNKQDSRLYCTEGVWSGNLPPCSPAHCSNNPPVPENGRMKSLRAIGHGSSVEYECFPLYTMEGKSNVICYHGQWTGSPPTCKDSRCYLKKLNAKEGVDLTDGNPIESNQRAHIVCIKGYTLRYPEVYCENGVLKTENLLSPCQENECEVKQISNGKILKEKTVPITNFFGIETGKDTVREEANIGSVETSGAVLYVECNDEYTFQGEEEEVQKHVGITCRRGEWTPLPVCLLPGKPIENETPIVDEEVTSVPRIKELGTRHSSIITSSQEPYTGNTTADEDLDGGHVMLDNNSTENEEAVVTDATVNPPCSCKYVVQDSILLAHDGKKLIKYNDEILSGSTIRFYCDHTEIYRLRGRTSLTCPENCDWHSSMFPSCVGPSDDDVVIAVFAFPTENMKVGLGGIFYVIPQTRLEFRCRAHKGSRRYVEWINPRGRGYTQPVIDDKEVYRSYYVVPKARPEYSGKYTCSIPNGAFHSVDIEIRDVECPKIESTKELGVSYAPNRKFGGRANFHCFFPHLRNGPSYITCEASGLWSGPPPSCSLPTCSIGSVYDILVEGIVPLVDGVREDVPYGYELKLGCDGKGLVLTGGRTAICSGNGYWKSGNNLQCIQGCGSFQKENGSDLLISPDKEIYSMGESITFSCPSGKDLTTDVQRILCFSSGWTPNVGVLPDCQ